MKKNIVRGFTLIELLVVIGIIGILAAVVLVAVNPGRQFAQARDTQRRSDLLQITNAIYQFAAEHDGNLPDTDGVDATSNFPQTPTCIGNGTSTCATNAGDGGTYAGCSGMTSFNLAAATDEAGTEIIAPTYIADVPTDPSGGTVADTGYCISVDTTTGRVTASALGELPVAAVTVER
ncbi:type II secretion system protein [Candidatus Microgenomates bacterium]|nr:MAG: type II secretion system protein [Candidatus Microgenomates bacterium]